MPTKSKYHTDPQKYLAASKAWKVNNPDAYKALNRGNQKTYLQRKKIAAFAVLGNKCARCPVTDIRCLQVNHVEGNGHAERRERRGGNTIALYRRIIAGSRDLQLLCANCNWIKRWENNEHN